MNYFGYLAFYLAVSHNVFSIYHLPQKLFFCCMSHEPVFAQLLTSTTQFLRVYGGAGVDKGTSLPVTKNHSTCIFVQHLILDSMTMLCCQFMYLLCYTFKHHFRVYSFPCKNKCALRRYPVVHWPPCPHMLPVPLDDIIFSHILFIMTKGTKDDSL